MLYNSLKIVHILSASIVLTSIVYCFHLWRSLSQRNTLSIPVRIQLQTTFIIIPFALVQLATGFTMISLQHESFSHFWLGGSVLSFVIAITCWFSFMYFLLLSQRSVIDAKQDKKHYRRIQGFMLLFCALGLLSMLFFMANKTVLN